MGRACCDVPGGEDGDGGDDGGEEEHEEAEAVDAGAVLDVEGGDPEVALLELHGGGGGVEVGPEDEGEG